MNCKDITQKIHGKPKNVAMMAQQGASMFLSSPSNFPPNNPLKKGKSQKIYNN